MARKDLTRIADYNWRVVLAHTEENPFMFPAMREWYCTGHSHTQTLLDRLIANERLNHFGDPFGIISILSGINR